MSSSNSLVQSSRKPPRRKAIVFGDDTRSFLSIVRSLGRKGIEVHAAPFDFQSAALKSRYVHTVHYLPYYLGDGSGWLQAVTALFERESFDFAIPCDERALLPLHRHQASLGRSCHLAIPDDRALSVFFDKHETRELARSLAVAVAPGRRITPTETVDDILATTPLPVVIKPRWSFVIDDLAKRGKVVVVRAREELEALLPHLHGDDHLFEGFFAGVGVGVSILASKGVVLQIFQHRRVHELTGSAFYRVSEPVLPALEEAVQKLASAIEFTGIAMFEFKVNPTDQTWIMLEVNARPWGSLPLPVGLGIDFPFLWYQLLVEGIEAPRRTYRSGVHARNLLPDLAQFVTRLTTSRLGLAGTVSTVAETGAEYFRVFVGREFYDVMQSDDPVPGIVEISSALRQTLHSWFWKSPAYRKWRRSRDLKAARIAAATSGKKPFRIVFVCQGNICRSPFAAVVATKVAADDGVPASVSSAGLLPRTGVPSPEMALHAARDAGFDLADHRSRHFERELASSADLVVIFDRKNHDWLRHRFPDLGAPVVYLGSFMTGTEGTREIADPDGQDLEVFRTTYASVGQAVAGLTTQIRQARRS